jgi:hypothetical protein
LEQSSLFVVIYLKALSTRTISLYKKCLISKTTQSLNFTEKTLNFLGI